MKINLGDFSLFDGLINFTNVSVDMSFDELLAAMLNKALPKEARKQAWEHVYDQYQTSEPGSPEYEAVIGLCKDGTWSDTETELNEEPEPSSEPKQEPGSEPEQEPGSEPEQEPGSEPEYKKDFWEDYKSKVIIPLLSQYESPTDRAGKKKTKAVLKAEAATLADLRKCASMKLGMVFDEDTLKLVYKARVKLYGLELGSEPKPSLELVEPDSELVEASSEPGLELYTLAQNPDPGPEVEAQYQVLVVSDPSEIPNKTDLYLDENGEIGTSHAIKAEWESRFKPGSRFQPRFQPSDLASKLEAIALNPDYTPEEKKIRARNVEAMMTATRF
jgi:hypothetical protein